MKYFKNYLLYAPDSPGGAPESEPDTDGETPPDVLTFDGWLSTQDAAVRSLIGNHIAGLKSALKAERARSRKLESQAPADGTAVLTPDQAQQWQAYQALGDPAALATLQTDYRQLQRRQAITQAAQAVGYKDSVLATLAGELNLEMREVEQDGTKTAVPHVVADDGAATPLPDYAASHWQDFMPALQQQPQAPQTAPQTFIRQQPGDRPRPSNAVDAALSKRYGRPKTAGQET